MPNSSSIQTPVLLILFNRFDTALQVIAQLRLAKVQRLYLFSDGPRTNRASESAILNEVQEKILAQIDWPCEIITRFEPKNEGPRLAIGKAITWFFEHEEEGIVLEHDCVPNQSFFHFCQELLTHYRHDERIMHISGDNFQFGNWRGDGSYYFSKLNHIWGFATWRRAWKQYDVDMKAYPEFREKGKVNTQIDFARGQKIWTDTFDKTFSGALQTWDYQWTFAMWLNDGLAILPNKNLVSNVGFDALALNTTNPNHRLANMETFDIKDIAHPSVVQIDAKADKYSINEVFNPTILKFALRKFGLIK